MNQHYFGTCARGLERILAKELEGIQATDIRPGRGGVYFAGTTHTLYKACLQLRTVVRVLKPILEVDVFNTDQLYDAVRSINWQNYITIHQTLAVDCNVRNSYITHSQYAARRVKDAICDQFRDRTGQRPNVDTETPNLGLNLHIGQNHMILSLDSSWDSLHKRGYRPIQVKAPLNESLAAGLLLHLGYDGSTPLVDPMCGSGTFGIEGAWIASNRPPGLTRKWFSFFGWRDFDKGLWAAIRDEARKQVKPTLPHKILGSDIRGDAIEFAENNARAAGVGHLTKFIKQDLRQLRPSTETPGLMICNPPYGERLGEERELAELYQALGRTFKEHFPGWRLAVLTSSEFLANQISLTPTRQTPFYNGSLECRLLEFSNEPRP